LLAFDATTGARLTDQLIATSGPPTDLIALAAVPEPTGLVIALVATLASVLAAYSKTP
jgi:hypothetical protein